LWGWGRKTPGGWQLVLNLVDFPEEQQCSGAQVAETCADFFACGLWRYFCRVEGEDKKRGPGVTAWLGMHREKAHIILYPETLAAGVDFRSCRVGVDGLEADTEFSYLRQIFSFGTFPDTAHPSGIPLIERTSVMGNLQSVVEKAEKNTGSTRILHILKKLENEVCSVCV
jgi:hypothetical protein